MIYPDANPWDGAAVSITVTEAGGKVTDLTRQAQRYDQRINGFIASNGQVHDDVLTAASTAPRRQPTQADQHNFTFI